MEEKELTGRIINKFYKVYNTLGYGFLENVYQNALILELTSDGLIIETEKPITVLYEGRVVGNFYADLVVESRIIVELKAKERLAAADEAQLVNYLRASELEIALLFNFGKSPEFKRKFFSNANKGIPLPSGDNELLSSLFVSDPF